MPKSYLLEIMVFIHWGNALWTNSEGVFFRNWKKQVICKLYLQGQSMLATEKTKICAFCACIGQQGSQGTNDECNKKASVRISPLAKGCLR